MGAPASPTVQASPCLADFFSSRVPAHRSIYLIATQAPGNWDLFILNPRLSVDDLRAPASRPQQLPGPPCRVPRSRPPGAPQRAPKSASDFRRPNQEAGGALLGGQPSRASSHPTRDTRDVTRVDLGPDKPRPPETHIIICPLRPAGRHPPSTIRTRCLSANDLPTIRPSTDRQNLRAKLTCSP